MYLHSLTLISLEGIGLSLSKFQILKANEITEKAKLQDRLKFIVADAMNMPLTNNTFDLSEE